MHKTMKLYSVALLMLCRATSLVHSAPMEKTKPSSAVVETFADIEKSFGFVPQFFKQLPEVTIPGTWEEMKELEMNPNTALPAKVKELIALGVAAQIPCRYCILGSTEFAKLEGATEAEIGEAVTMAANTRHWSTFMNGIQTDETKFRREISLVLNNLKKSMAPGAPASRPIIVTDGASALKDITQTFGFVPDFLKKFPDIARAGAWRSMKDLQMNANAAIEGKYKDLISLAVASQIPCKFCIISDTEFAKFDGATEAEIFEAIAVASFTRQMSTLFNGFQIDETQFRADLDRLVKGAQAANAADQKSKMAKSKTGMPAR
jgi:AhpD family alkylhydroperoxidase